MTSLMQMENSELNSNGSYAQPILDAFFKDCTPEEIALCAMVSHKTGLSIVAKQLYPVKRYDSKLGRNVLTVQTSIDGLRLIADRSGKFVPGRTSTYEYDEKGNLISATSYVKKMTADGSWHEVAATAYYDEYVQRTKEGKITSFWATKPRIMLAKCAESLALRKSFPAELSGLYTTEEMPTHKAELEEINTSTGELLLPEKAQDLMSEENVCTIIDLLQGQDELRGNILKAYGIQSIADLPGSKAASIIDRIKIKLGITA